MMPISAHNKTGYFESKPFSDLLDNVLDTAGSSWHDWQPFNPNWMPSSVAQPFIDDAAEMLSAEYGDSKFFLIKNPRICRLLPFCSQVLEQFEAKPFFVLTHRNPLEVVASLVKRGGHNPILVYLLWLRHVLDAEFATRGHARYFTSYTEVLADWGTQMAQLQDVLGVTFPRDILQIRKEIGAFLTPSLRHHVEPPLIGLSNPDVSEWTRSVFEILERWVGGAGDKKDFEKLDEIRDQFDAMALNVGAIVQDGVNLPKVTSDAAIALADTKNTLIEIEGQLTSATAALEKQTIEAPAKIEELTKAHAAKVAQITAEKEAAQAKSQAHVKAVEVDRDQRLKQMMIKEAELNKEMQVRFDELADLGSLLVESNAEQERITAARAQERMVAQKEQRHMDEVISQKDTDFHDLKVRTQAADIAFEAITSSTSWKLTAPLRKMMSWLRPKS
jgi:hypothetical protein